MGDEESIWHVCLHRSQHGVQELCSYIELYKTLIRPQGSLCVVLIVTPQEGCACSGGNAKGKEILIWDSRGNFSFIHSRRELEQPKELLKSDTINV